MKNDSLKIVLIVAIIAIAGYFLYTNFAKTDAGQQGAVISGTSTTTSNPNNKNCSPAPGVYYGGGANPLSCTVMTNSCTLISGFTVYINDINGNVTGTCCNIGGTNCVQKIVTDSSGQPGTGIVNATMETSTTTTTGTSTTSTKR